MSFLSFCLISIFGFQGTTHRSNQLKIKPACIFIFICICIACLHAVSKSQICECGVLATRVPDAAGEASASEVQVVYTTFSSLTLLGLSGLEPPTSRLSGVRSNRLSYKPRLVKQVHIWHTSLASITIIFYSGMHSSLPAWRLRDSNSRPPACKAGALPTELSPHKSGSHLLSHAVSSIVSSAA